MTDKLCYYLNVCPKGTNITTVNTLLLEEQREREQCEKNGKEEFGGEIPRFRKKNELPALLCPEHH